MSFCSPQRFWASAIRMAHLHFSSVNIPSAPFPSFVHSAQVFMTIFCNFTDYLFLQNAAIPSISHLSFHTIKSHSIRIPYAFHTHSIRRVFSSLFIRWNLAVAGLQSAVKSAANPHDTTKKGLIFRSVLFGPSGEIRTHGLLNPIQARYQNCATPGYLLWFISHTTLL